MPSVRLARVAMASRFELVLQGDDETWLRAAGEEALDEIERLDRQLSIYSASSEVSRINDRAADGPVRVEPRLFELLKTSKQLSESTGGAFDITVAPLMRAWGFFRGTGRLPDEASLEKARAVTGMNLVHLDESDRTIRFERKGVLLDFGAIGKGYALDEAMLILKETGVERAFLHGGTSTAYGLGTPEDGTQWQVAIPYPGKEKSSDEESVLAVAPLENASLSVSAVWGKAFEAGDKTYGHVLDARRGVPVEGAMLTAVIAESAAESDAFSTALLVQGRDSDHLFERTRGQRTRDQLRALLLFPSDEDGVFDTTNYNFPTLPSNRQRASPGLP